MGEAFRGGVAISDQTVDLQGGKQPITLPGGDVRSFLVSGDMKN